MICPRCKELGLKSKIYDSGKRVSTAAYYQPYYDEEGTYHIHDCNASTGNMSCSNGHQISIRESKSCPNCDWGIEGEVRVHEYDGPSQATTFDSNGLTYHYFDTTKYKLVGTYKI